MERIFVVPLIFLGVGIGGALVVLFQIAVDVLAAIVRKVLQRGSASTIKEVAEPETETEAEVEGEPEVVVYPGGHVLEWDVAPLFADLHQWGIVPDGVRTLRHRDSQIDADATEFLFHDKRAAEKLVSLLMTVSERAGTGFESPDSAWDVRTRMARANEPCEDCTRRHVRIWVAVRTPKSAIPSLESDIHQYLYPGGMSDIADA